MRVDLTGRRVVITAGGSGIGRVMAERFADVGASVAVCDVDDAALKDLAATRPGIFGARADVGQAGEVDAFFDAAIARLGGLDVLVNNAGVSGPTKPVEAITPEEWERTIGVNLNGAFFCTRRAVPLFKAQRSGVIVNLSSTAGRMGMPNRSPYSAAKYGVRGFTDVMAIELGEHNIRVNAILPGVVDGPRGRRVITEQAEKRGMSFEEYLPNLLHNVSMHTMIDQEEVADLAIFLASDYARHISGQSIGVCGNFESYRAPRTVTA
ncbi:MAG TPA: SDR family oxidoreductase [Geminicoccus sp.]|uniref:SDR family oxidoreductase n=1 Tax=Geminicoccus sp. TaxID=2024832 RepID=UPI002C659D3F|nr:SDR family oxidoreductase [Geminicoccus sp.]HWL71769.1 SDR family oxidoreductase [Geminicoccus sp.]